MSAVQKSDVRRRAALRLAIRRLTRQVKRDRLMAIPAIILPGIGSTFVLYVPPLLIAGVLTRYGRGRTPDLGELLPSVLLIAVAWFTGEAIWRTAIHLLNRTETRGMERLYVEAMDELLAKDLSFFHDNFSGSLTKKALNYARSYEGFVDVFAFSILDNVIPLALVTAVLWRFTPWLVLVLLGMMTLTACLVMPFIRRRQALVDQRETASNALAGHVADSITNMEAVRGFARERAEARIHARNVGSFIKIVRRSWDYQNQRVDMVTAPLYVLTNVIGLTVAIAVSTTRGLDLGAVFLTFSYFASSTRIMWDFSRIYRNLESTLTEAAQFTELLLDAPKVTDPRPPVAVAPVDSSIVFDQVRFQHDDRGDAALFDDLRLHIGSGERVGLVGRSGGGKTTVTRLLLRFMDVSSGQIMIGGQNIASVSQEGLRSLIAYVPQDPTLFHRSIADNIRFGRPDASDEEVHEAARLAHAAEFIEVLPSGYGTLIGERGVKLSGGQRQRVAIARAMLKDAPILVLDEATSSLDSESERHIQQALWELMAGRTAIVIAHRLSTVQRMDRLVVLEEGRIIEQGSHRELLALGGMYAELWGHQSGGFLRDEDLAEITAAGDAELSDVR